MEIQLSTPAPTFSVIIVNYNGGDFVQGALTSLATQTRRDFEVILVDNASSDGSIDNLDTSGLPSFTLMAETENHGFARGNNLGAARAGATWLALLNPDAAARPDWLDRIASATARHPSVSSFASLQLAMGREGIMDGAGDNYLAFGIPWRGGYGRPVRDVPVEGECFSPCGAGAIYHRQTFLSAGGFDERLFCFCEDVDLGFRLRLLGETCIFLPDAVIDHFGGGTSDKVSGFAVHHGTRNRLWVYLKNMPLPLLMLTLPGHVASAPSWQIAAASRPPAPPRSAPSSRPLSGTRCACSAAVSPSGRSAHHGAVGHPPPVRPVAERQHRAACRVRHQHCRLGPRCRR